MSRPVLISYNPVSSWYCVDTDPHMYIPPERTLADELEEIAEHCAGLPALDSRQADEILGYDDTGLPR